MRLQPTPAPQSAAMRVGVIDAGANTLRLLVARQRRGELVPVRESRVRLGLGEEIERAGRLSKSKLAAVALAASEQAELARRMGCERLEVLVTSPGRQSANADALRKTLERATGASVRMLSGEDEALLGYAGALAGLDPLPGTVAVCDVGGGSTQIVIGTFTGGPAWARSIDIGSLRLTRRSFAGDPPDAEEIAAARAEVIAAFDGVVPPPPQAALAIGGSARAAGKLVGAQLGSAQLARAAELLARRPAAGVATRFRVAPQRAQTLLAGVLILAELQRRIGMPFQVRRGGIREGAALELLARSAAA